MQKAQFGAWYVYSTVADEDDENPCVEVRTVDGDEFIVSLQDEGPHANLIAAAPELYEALYELWKAYLPQPQGGIPQHVVDRRDAARSKARTALAKVRP